MAEMIPLRTYRFHVRKANIQVEHGALRLYLPSFFGNRRWTIPVAEVAVCDLGSWQLNDHSGGVLLREALRIPYLFATGPLTTPTTLLLFQTPQRIPPLRLVFALGNINTDVPYTWRQSRSKDGAYLDGVLLRARDPEAATQQLVATGVTPVNAPTEWLEQHRSVVADPIERQRIEAQLTRAVWIARASAALVYGSLLLAAFLLGEDDPAWVWALLAVAFIVGIVLRRVARRMESSPPP